MKVFQKAFHEYCFDGCDILLISRPTSLRGTRVQGRHRLVVFGHKMQTSTRPNDYPCNFNSTPVLCIHYGVRFRIPPRRYAIVRCVLLHFVLGIVLFAGLSRRVLFGTPPARKRIHMFNSNLRINRNEWNIAESRAGQNCWNLQLLSLEKDVKWLQILISLNWPFRVGHITAP